MRSEFKRPCIPYEDTGANKIGFSSGEVDVATTSDNVRVDQLPYCLHDRRTDTSNLGSNVPSEDQ